MGEIVVSIQPLESLEAKCGYCQELLKELDLWTCEHCQTPLHSLCHKELQVCATLGCRSRRRIDFGARRPFRQRTPELSRFGIAFWALYEFLLALVILFTVNTVSFLALYFAYDALYRRSYVFGFSDLIHKDTLTAGFCGLFLLGVALFSNVRFSRMVSEAMRTFCRTFRSDD